MHKYMITMVLFSGFALVSTANAADGTINFTGSILDSACTVTGSTQTVALGSVVKSAFTAAGNTASPTKFSITLSSCPEATKTAIVSFDGTTNTTNSNLLALTSGSAATGVGVGIYESDNTTIIPVGTHSASKTLSTTASTTFNFIAKYVATAAAVTAGSANAVSDVTISYN